MHVNNNKVVVAVSMHMTATVPIAVNARKIDLT